MQQDGNIRRSTAAAELWENRKPEIIREYANGEASQEQMAQRYGVSLAGFQKALARLGVKPKSKARSGHLNGRYRDGSQSTAYRGMIKKSACAECGTTESLCVHHVDGNHMNNALENLVVLCMSCHSSLHKKDYWNRVKGGQS